MGISSSRTEVPPGAKTVVVDNSQHSGFRLVDLKVDDATRVVLTGIGVMLGLWILVKLVRFIRNRRKKTAKRRKELLSRMEMMEQGSGAPPAPPPTPMVVPIQAFPQQAFLPALPRPSPSTAECEALPDLSRNEQLFWSRLNAAR